MTAVSLFDVLARESPTAVGGPPHPADRLLRIAERLVESSLAEWEQLRRFEQEFSPSAWDGEGRAMEITRSIYALFEEWGAEAEQVLTRTRRLSASGAAVRDSDALEDAYGHVQARLKLTPEMIARVMEQVRQGQFVPAKELRDELRARLRA